ncbi:ribosome quality control complex subunit TCF25 isoform X1 [Procambarus clarkii]|uniref:ribosome quality control complex subunit TCF25 isoform X1 n=1 Tax=Procambarus clarkii TaxID=6728 RepID=UPI001E6732FA|nr:transcription factor 25-like isoform X1 [Procambarus clarkii]XP_045606256.1 transcription factor 25-like isoform X1 [Procambarus clarkii]XP_045606257.1 transcription factor 25-like isoform X1 [Procambarus clarkii]XP_045606258.1 transcription factor 25-like isoform X1 [Procambarus clarkii]
MSTRALRKLQGGRGDLDLPNSCPEEEEDDDEQEVEEPPIVPSKGQNRFDLLIQGSPSESEVKEDDDLTEPGEGREDVHRDGLSPQPPLGSGAKRKRKKKKKRGRVRVPASSEDPTDNDKDEIDNIIEEVNAISGETRVQVSVEKATSDKLARNLLNVEHKHLNPQNEMKRIFGSKVVQANENNRRRGRTGRSVRSTWIVQGHPNWAAHPRPGISMVVAESTPTYPVFKYVHSQTYQQFQFRFLEAVESLNPENIMTLLNHEPFHVDTLLQVSEIFRLGDDSAMAAQLIERALYVLETASHPLFNIATGVCRLQYRQQENRSLFIALFRHILNVGQKGCYRTALELCKLLLSLSPDDDPMAVSLMIDFYALRAQEYEWLVALYDMYEPSKNLSMLPSFSYSVPLALFHLSVGGDQPSGRDKREAAKAAALAEELGSVEEMRKRADTMIQKALIMFPGVLMPLLDKCNIQPDPVVASHAFFGPAAQIQQSKGLTQIVNLYVGRCYHVWKEAGVMTWLEENVQVVLARVDSGDPLVKEGEEIRKVRYQGTPMAIYRHILMAEIKHATAALPAALANSPVMSYDPLPPPDTICGYSRPPSSNHPTSNSSSILASFFRSLLPNYDPNAPDPDEGAEGAVALQEAGGEEEGQAVGDLRASVNTLLDAMRDLLSNIHLPEPPGNEADMSEEENNEWD